MMRGCRFCRCVVAILTTVFFAGCAFWGENFRVTEPLGRKRVMAIRIGESTAHEVMVQFGPPLVVARPGKTMTVPQLGSWLPSDSEVQSETFFALFAGSGAWLDASKVYYYQSAVRKGFGFVLILGGGRTTTWLARERLWLLVSDETGRIAGMVYDDGEALSPEK
jgi:hypothetical protein